MNQYQTIGQLYEDEPRGWGLRGDKFLWREMREHFSQTPLPPTATEFEQKIEQAFQLLSGQPISTSYELFFVEKYAHGGMSSGGISLAFWIESALPLLRARYVEACQSGK